MYETFEDLMCDVKNVVDEYQPMLRMLYTKFGPNSKSLRTVTEVWKEGYKLGVIGNIGSATSQDDAPAVYIDNPATGLVMLCRLADLTFTHEKGCLTFGDEQGGMLVEMDFTSSKSLKEAKRLAREARGYGMSVDEIFEYMIKEFKYERNGQN